MDPIRPWKLLTEQVRLDFRIFRVRQLTVADPRSGAEHPRVVLDATDWCNVIAVTKDAQVVLIRQFRFGTWSPTLEIPGGMVDEGEDPQAAAVRELEEETGYRPGRVIPLGAHHPNPAILGNRLHTYLALDCERVHGGNQEESEDIAVELYPRADLPRLVQEGAITHSLVLAAFLLEAWRPPA